MTVLKKKEPDIIKTINNCIIKFVFNNNFDVANNENIILKIKLNYQFTSKLTKHLSLSSTTIDNGIDLINYFIQLITDDNCIPFWNDEINEISKNIFLPIAKNIIKNRKPNTFKSNNWFDTEHYKNIEPKENIITSKDRVFSENNLKTRKIKLYLLTNQKEYLKRVLGVYRYFYNRTLQYINNYDKITQKTHYTIDNNEKNNIIWLDLKKDENKFSFYTARNYLKENYPSWMNEINVNSHLIDKAINEATSNYKKCCDEYKKKKKVFKLKFKTKKNKYQTMNIEKGMINQRSNTLFTRMKYKDESIFKRVKSSFIFSEYKNICDSSITYVNKLNEFYLNLSYKENNKNKDSDILKNNKVCSIDPGLTCFATCYSDNETNKIGLGVSKTLNKYCSEIDIIVSKINKKHENTYINNHQRRRNLKKALHRKIKKIQNIKEELHNKTVKFLTSKYARIIVPPFETQEMVKKSTSSKLSRSLYNVSFYTFLLKLKAKCESYDIELIIRPEYYTSKTCTRCGEINSGLKLSDRIYNCKECKLKIDRDINGARNIMLRNNNWELPPLRK